MKISKRDLFLIFLFSFFFLFSLIFLDKFKIPKTRVFDVLFYLFKEIYSYIILTILILLALVYINRKYKSKLKKESLSILITILLVFLLKFLISRERPEQGMYIGSSFPSNHSAITSSILPFLKKEAFIIWLFVCFYVGLSRAYWSYHYFSDVFGGILVGFLVGVVVKSLKFKKL